MEKLQLRTLAAPLSAIPIGPTSYPVATLTAADLRARSADVALMAKSSGQPITGKMLEAYARMTMALINGQHPELTLEYVMSWESPALCTMVAMEFERQFHSVFGKSAFGTAGTA
jgi:hypothetical protein